MPTVAARGAAEAGRPQRARAAGLFLLVLSLLSVPAQAAAAAWLVIASTSPGVPVGTLVADPSTLALEEGASVTLLAEDGRLLTRRPQASRVESSLRVPAVATGVAAAIGALLAAGEGGARIGAVRGAGLSGGPAGGVCASPTTGLDRLARAGCREEVALRLAGMLADELPLVLRIYAADREGFRYRYGEAIDLHAVATFEADLRCWMEQEGVVEPLLPRAGLPAPRLRPSRPHRLFGGEGPRPVATPPPGRSRIRCFAVHPADRPRVEEILAAHDDPGAGLAALSRAVPGRGLRAAADEIALEVAGPAGAGDNVLKTRETDG